MRGFHWESVAEEPTFEMYRFTLIFPSLSRASAIAYAVCIRSSVSIFGPKAFSIRSAMSGDSAARPLRRAESAGLVTPRISAALVTERSSGSITSILMNCPGWDGRTISIVESPSMIVLKIKIEYFSRVLVDSECDPPVPGDGKTPYSLSVPGKLVNFPTRDVVHFQGRPHLLQKGHDISDPLDNWRGQPGSIVMLNEAPQSAVNNVPNYHKSC